MRYALLLMYCLTLSALNSCALRSHDYYNHTQLVTADSLRDIIAVELINGAEIKFANNGGVYSPAAHEVKGRTESGRLVVVPVDQIASCLATPPSGIRSILGVLGVIGGLIVLVVIFLGFIPRGTVVT